MKSLIALPVPLLFSLGFSVSFLDDPFKTSMFKELR